MELHARVEKGAKLSIFKRTVCGNASKATMDPEGAPPLLHPPIAMGLSRVKETRLHTVEVHLSRAYAKLGVRSRGQLAARIHPEVAAKD